MPATRRELLLGTAGLLLSGAAPRALARRRAEVARVESTPSGTTLWLRLESAPFPFRDQRYRDDTVIVFVPASLASRARSKMPPGDAADVLVYFHGHMTTADDSVATKRLREQVVESGREMVLVVPQLAVNARDSHAGKLTASGGFARMLEDALGASAARVSLPRIARAGSVELAAHSGGFEAAAMVISHGGASVRGLYLFDALYGYARRFGIWLQSDPNRRLLSYYRDNGKVGKWTRKQKADLDARRITWSEERAEGDLSRARFAAARAVFIESRVDHMAMPFGNSGLRDCLESWTPAWKKDTRAPRELRPAP